MCGGKLFGQEAITSTLWLHFFEEIQATASIDFGGRFRSAMRRLGAQASFRYACSWNFDTAVTNLLCICPRTGILRLDANSDFNVRSCDDQVDFAVDKLRALKEFLAPSAIGI